MTIKAIETHYKGYRFRSRLEARWAVFLDNMEIKWRYEPQGYILNGTPYLPDFLIEPDVWLEIKPTLLSDEEEELCRLLANGTGYTVHAVGGNIGPEEFTTYTFTPDGKSRITDGILWQDLNDHFQLLLLARTLTEPRPLRRDHCKDLFYRAFRAARSARFEHGETPR